jgi:galactokinase
MSEGAGGFAEVYGSRPEGVWAAPGRVNLIGEHTDYNDGFVMPLALPHTCRVEASRRDDGMLRMYSADAQDSGVIELRADALRPLSAPVSERLPGAPAAERLPGAPAAERLPGSHAAERLPGAPAAERPPGAGGWAAYPAGVLWALREAGHQVGGADLHFTSTVPTGAGLSSSAAIEVSTALALNDLYDLGLPPHRIAQLSQRAENDFAGVPCGVMDQMASACCTAGHALYLDTRDLTRRQVPFDLDAWGLRLLVVDTRVKHELGDGEYAKRRAGCEAAAAQLGVAALRDVPLAELADTLGRLHDPEVRALVRHVVTENARVEEAIELLDAGKIRAIGPVLTAGHASLRDDFRVSCAELDLVVEAANDTGALGARMTGGGFGGSALVLAETEVVEEVGKGVNAAFATAGYRIPRVFDAVPSPGAHRVA